MKVWSTNVKKTIIILLFFCNVSFGQEKTVIHKSIDSIEEIVSRLIKNDSIVEARTVLDTVYKKYQHTKHNNFWVIYNYNYGVLFNSSAKFKEALKYLLESQKYSNKTPNKLYKERISGMMLRIYREVNMYKELDSLYAINIVENKKNNSVAVFLNYTDYVISCMRRKQYKKVIDTTNKAILELDAFDFTDKSKRIIKSINKVVRNELKLHLAMALIEKKEDYKKSYQLLDEVNKDSLLFVKRERDQYLRLISQYKARYFYEFDKNIDSVFYHQSLSNKYQEVYIKKLKERASNASDFIYEIAKNKNDTEKLSIINNTNIQLKKNYAQISFLISFLLLLAIIFSAYVFRSYSQNNKINKKLKDKNEELLAVDEERNQFFSVMSHELRTPIYTIQGLIEIIENTTNETQRKEFLKTLQFSNNHLSSLVNNALEYSKFRLGNVRLNKDAFCLDEMLQEIGNSFSYQLHKNNTTLHIDISPRTETNVIGDRLKISQLFINLISNAIKFTVNGNIWVKVIQLTKIENTIMFRFVVKDDGIGIEKELQADIFNGFKGVNHINENTGGSGLGLYIVKKIIEDLYKSSIQLESKKDKGTTFSFDIEMKQNLQTITTINLKGKDCEKILKGYHILIVDDNKINLMITKKVLESAGANCIIVDNGVEAIAKIQKNNFDIVFMDVHMPGQDGLQTTQKIREFNKKVIILALTAVDLEKNIKKIGQSGMNGIITKPYKKSDLFQKIRSYPLK
ncbi:hybrid sensor histidine kinase/response regulator [Aquimarina muelleri]|uniref:hybrid sensor histidine kinase/response regulator n=1 Tax=Aquimarina muelleri TaxID=279356 RepID=UPI003F687C8A